MKKFLCMLLSAAMIAVCAGGCGTEGTDDTNAKISSEGSGAEDRSGEKITLTVTVMAKELGDPTLYERYMKEHENIIINEVPMENSSSKLLSMIASGDPPDIIRLMGYDELPVFVTRGLLAPLDEYIEQSSAVNLDDAYDIVDICRFDGSARGAGPIYAIPKDWSPTGLWIDKTAFEDAGIPLPSTTEPMTWEEFGEIAKALTIINNGAVERHGCVTALTFPSLLEMYLNSNGSSLWTEDLDSTTLNTPETRAAVEFFMDLHNNAALGSSLYPPTDNIGTSALPYGKTAMALGGYWFRAQWDTTGFLGQVEDKLMFVPAPVGSKEASYALDLTSVGLFSGTKHPQEAWELLEYIVASETAVHARVDIGYGIPAFQSYFDGLPNATAFDQQLLDTVTNYQMRTLDLTPSISPYINYTSLTTLFDKYYVPVLYGQSDLDEALSTINSETEILIEEGKELAEGN